LHSFVAPDIASASGRAADLCYEHDHQAAFAYRALNSPAVKALQIRKQPIVRPDELLPVGLQHDGIPLATYAGINHGQDEPEATTMIAGCDKPAITTAGL
jgi:hypothetical protein